MDKTKESKLYHKVKNQLFFLSLMIDILILMVLATSGLSIILRNFSTEFSSHFLVINGIYITIFVVGMYLLHFPIRLFEGFMWEHRFHLSNQKFIHWFADDFKKVFINGVITILAV